MPPIIAPMDEPWSAENDPVPPPPRRDAPIPPPWYQEVASTPLSEKAHEEARRAVRIWRIVGLVVAVFLISYAINVISAYVALSEESRFEITFAAFYAALIQIAGWWFVGWALTRR